MSDFAVRAVEDSELRTASTVFLGSLHQAPLTDEKWAYWTRNYEPGRTLGAFADGQMIGTALAWSSSLTVPGGAALPMAAVTAVGVRADHTRRGVLTELMRVQLADARDRGEPLAGLHASEAVIYGRFGYGLAVLSRNIRITRRDARLRPEVPRAGEVRLLGNDEALGRVQAGYDRVLGSRPGVMGRSAGWWVLAYEQRLAAPDQHVRIAAHTGPDGVDGFATYVVDGAPTMAAGENTSLFVRDFQAANQAAANGLWRYLLGVDLVEEVVAFSRPMDEPLEAILVDPRAVRATFQEDLWLRLVDVPRALAGRTYGAAEPVVIEVRDRLLPANSGRYRIGPHGTEPTTEPAGLAMDADVLAMLYLGAWRASALAGTGRIEVADAAAPARADRLFSTDAAPYCGTMF
ncbi:MAG TPA: GNAT family N-acetyltransferase [Actinophytocola sp.]|uniref:GNAT family N-acetyltransferase n=1 Tax=Actinophytocola sp. TaxID=1872138 RepID=UPI002DBE1C13|nr:GNAT family N-acetyltransferase [Actinophytocola sp.]HEU5474839.1 GNAT family N-acetyltransferase [Actinophytocola sp.]